MRLRLPRSARVCALGYTGAMLGLVAVNVLGAVVFAGLYAAGAAARVGPAALLTGLTLGFASLTVLWVRIEQRSRVLDPLRRLSRGAIGLLAVVVGLPAVVLMPLFWLEGQLPPEAAQELHLGATMALLLAGLALVVLMNVVGAVVTVALALNRRRHSAAP